MHAHVGRSAGAAHMLGERAREGGRGRPPHAQTGKGLVEDRPKTTRFFRIIGMAKIQQAQARLVRARRRRGLAWGMACCCKHSRERTGAIHARHTV